MGGVFGFDFQRGKKENNTQLAMFGYEPLDIFKGISLPYPSRHPMNSTVFIFEMIKLRSSKEYAQGQKLSS